MKDLIKQEITAGLEVFQEMLRDDRIAAAIQDIAEACIAAYRGGHKVLLAGNGGSAADAQHLAGELVSRFAFDRPGLPAFALSTDTSVMTAIGNDYGYDQLFARQIQAVGRAGDVFVGISTSGKSPNIIQGLSVARGLGLVTVGFTGAGVGDFTERCDLCLVIPSRETPKIQHGHIVAGHIICQLIEAALFTPPR
jgi:D-sedoheptulose 7-phosphate isomerase